MSDRDAELRAWLHTVPGVRADTLAPIAGDASFRRYFRVQTGDGPRIVMDAPPSHMSLQPFVSVTDVLAAIGVNVPSVQVSAMERGFLLLSDMGDVRFYNVLDPQRVDFFYRKAIDLLVKIQAGADPSAMQAYDRNFLTLEMQLFREWFLGRHLQIELGPENRRLLEHVFTRLCDVAAEQPCVFVHRDYHSRNLMVGPGDVLGLLDYQDAVRGPLSYDVVSLLRDVYLRWPRDQISRWLRYYFDAAGAHALLDVNFERFERWFDLMGVQRHLKICGIFSRLNYRDHKSGYLADIPLTLQYLQAVCPTHPETAPLARLLEDLNVSARFQHPPR